MIKQETEPVVISHDSLGFRMLAMSCSGPSVVTDFTRSVLCESSARARYWEDKRTTDTALQEASLSAGQQAGDSTELPGQSKIAYVQQVDDVLASRHLLPIIGYILQWEDNDALKAAKAEYTYWTKERSWKFWQYQLWVKSKAREINKFPLGFTRSTDSHDIGKAVVDNPKPFVLKKSGSPWVYSPSDEQIEIPVEQPDNDFGFGFAWSQPDKRKADEVEPDAEASAGAEGVSAQPAGSVEAETSFHLSLIHI